MLGPTHQRVRRLRRLVQKRSLRWSESVCVIEGPDLVRAALEASQEFEGIYYDAAQRDAPELHSLLALAAGRGVRTFALAAGVLERVADAQSPRYVTAAVRFVPTALDALPPRGTVIVLHDVRDPGNAGTVIRSADAAGATAVVLSGDSVDPYNPKALRATAGSIFHVPVAVVSRVDEVLTWFRAGGGQCWATVVNGGTSLYDATLSDNVLLLMGNEADGLDAATVARCDEALSIPMVGRNESLNLSVAAGLVLFEAMRQRRSPKVNEATPNIGTS